MSDGTFPTEASSTRLGAPVDQIEARNGNTSFRDWRLPQRNFEGA
jgi:hypothetical protein